MHAEAAAAEDTDWPQILALYRLLERSPRTRWSPSTRRSRWPWCTARGPGWRCSSRWRPTTGWPATTGCTRSGRTCWSWPASRRGRGERYRAAARRTTSLPEQRYLRGRAAHGAG